MKPLTYSIRVDLLPHFTGMHYLEVPATVVKKLGGKLPIRLICTVNGAVSFNCGIVTLGEGKGYITINKARLKQLGVSKGDVVEVALTKDESEYGMEVPEELTELLQQDPEGEAKFMALTKGKQRTLIHWISTIKNSQLRIDRALRVVNNLKSLPDGKVNFRQILGYE